MAEQHERVVADSSSSLGATDGDIRARSQSNDDAPDSSNFMFRNMFLVKRNGRYHRLVHRLRSHGASRPVSEDADANVQPEASIQSVLAKERLAGPVDGSAKSPMDLSESPEDPTCVDIDDVAMPTSANGTGPEYINMSDRNTAKMPKPPRKTKMSNMEILRSRFKSAGKDGHSRGRGCISLRLCIVLLILALTLLSALLPLLMAANRCEETMLDSYNLNAFGALRWYEHQIVGELVLLHQYTLQFSSLLPTDTLNGTYLSWGVTPPVFDAPQSKALVEFITEPSVVTVFNKENSVAPITKQVLSPTIGPITPLEGTEGFDPTETVWYRSALAIPDDSGYHFTPVVLGNSSVYPVEGSFVACMYQVKNRTTDTVFGLVGFGRTTGDFLKPGFGQISINDPWGQAILLDATSRYALASTELDLVEAVPIDDLPTTFLRSMSQELLASDIPAASEPVTIEIQIDDETVVTHSTRIIIPTVFPDGSVGDQEWVLTYYIAESTLYSNLRNALAEVTIAACAVVCISTLCAILFAFSLTLPLNRLSELLQRVALMDLHNVPNQERSQYHELRRMQNGIDLVMNNMKLYSAIKLSILVLDENMYVSFANPFFFFSFGIESIEEADEWVRKLLEADRGFADSLNSMSSAFYDSIIKEVEYVGPDGHPVHLKIHGRLDESRCTVLAIENITEQLRYEEQLEQALANAEKANLAKSQFLSQMSHELRTPLNGVIGMSSLIADMELTGEQQALVESIKFSADLLLSLISDILDLSKIEAGAVDLVELPLDILALIENLVISTSQSLNKTIELVSFVDPNIPALLIGDPRRLSQVLNNLLFNAQKFTDSGFVFVAVHLVGHDDDGRVRLHIECQDTGVGVKPEDQARLFEAFYQVNPNGPNGGTGLGLSIASALVKMMGGEQLNVSSEHRHGANFYFDVLLLPNHDVTPRIKDTSAWNQRANASLREQAVPMLEEQDTQAQNAEEAKANATRSLPTRLSAPSSQGERPLSYRVAGDGQGISNTSLLGPATAFSAEGDVKRCEDVGTQTETTDLSRIPAFRSSSHTAIAMASGEADPPAYGDTGTDKGVQTDNITPAHLGTRCLIISPTSALVTALSNYVPEEISNVAKVTLADGLDELEAAESAFSGADPTTAPVPYSIVIVDSVVFVPAAREHAKGETSPTTAFANGAKPDEPLADPDGQLEMLRERFGHVQDSLKRGAARRAARIERAGPGCAVSGNVLWIVLVNRRQPVDMAAWFKDQSRVLIVTKPVRYHHLLDAISSLHDEGAQSGSALGSNTSLSAGRVGSGPSQGAVDMDTFAKTSVAMPATRTNKGGPQRAVGTGKKAATIKPAFPKDLRVLLVEDNLVNIKVASTMLRTVGVEFDVAQNGKEAVDLITAGGDDRKKWHDIVLMDVQMPVMDGLQATTAIRRHEARMKARGSPLYKERKHIIIAMTADVLTQTVERCVQSGMDDYFPKPIRKQEFYKVVSAWAEHAQQNFIAQPDDTGTAAGKRAAGPEPSTDAKLKES